MVKFRKMLINEKGFTLIELLVVIAVLGILAAIAIPRLTGVTDKAKISEGETILATVKNASYMYNTEEGSWPDFTSQANLVTDLSGYVNNIDTLIPDTGDGWIYSTGTTGDSLTIQYGDGTTSVPNLILNVITGAIGTSS